MHFSDGWGMGFGGGLFMILFWALIIAGIVYLIKSFTGGPSCGKGPESALDILKKRYASGEISKEEFEQMKKDIES